MRFLKPDPKPETPPTPLQLRESLETLREDLRDSRAYLKKVSGWSSNLLGAAVGLGLITLLFPIKIPLIAAGALLSVIGYGVTRVIKQSVEEGIDEKQKQVEKLLSGPAPVAAAHDPAPAPAKKVTSAYNSEAARIEALEKRMKQLQDEIDGKPVVLDKPKATVSKLGFG